MDKLTRHLLPVLLFLSGYTVKVLGCGIGCESCGTFSNICTECNDGYWNHNGKCERCPDNCEQCSDDDNCSKCKATFWSTGSCGKQCPESCDDSGCEDDTGLCYKCLLGFYGTTCSENCTLCKDGLCDRSDGHCIDGCIDGYYMGTVNAVKTCRQCSKNCTLCLIQRVCSKCDFGFYKFSYENANFQPVVVCYACQPECEDCDRVENCTVCKSGSYGPLCKSKCVTGYKLDGTLCVPEITCSQNCADGCDENGLCVGDCTDGWSGKMCTTPCANQCEKCQQDNETVCTKCKYDFFTSSCDIPCNEHCSMLSHSETCGFLDGYCINGCSDGYWADACNKSCYEGCISTRCSQTDAACETCNRNNYGAACEHTCNEHCIDNSSSTYICRKSDGKCELVCENVYEGGKCEAALTTPSSGTQLINTTRNNIVSTSTTLDERNTHTPEGSDKQIGLIIGAGAGGGVAIIAIVCIVVVCIVIRRNRRKDDGSAGVNNVKDNQQQCQNDSDKRFQNTGVSIEEEGQDYIYAKPNKVKKNNKSTHEKSFDNVLIDLDAEKDLSEKKNDIPDEAGTDVAEETDVDEVLLENFDDEPGNIIVTEVDIPDSDTYYNTAGLIRSRVQIKNLLEYVKNKAEFETEFEKLPQGLSRPCKEAMKLHNRVKNRYNGIYAYDATRVVLQSKNYINANYVEGHSQSQVSYIASLGPTKATMMNNFATFWEMVWQVKTNKIIMLTNLEEAGKMKCEQYWPDQGNRYVCGDFVVSCTVEKWYSDFVVRELTIEKLSETRKVTQYHYTAWPDKTVPDTVASLIEFRDKVEQGQTPVTGPMIVHCSAGIGRTGTYISLDILIREGREEESVDIFGCVNALRGQRVNLVQNAEQYVFLHHCVLYALTCDADSLPASAVPHIMTNEKISTQYQDFVGMQSPSDSDERLGPTSRKEIRKGADIPGDDYRVRVFLTEHDFINAAYVNGYKKKNQFIAAQTPLPDTTEHFVSLLYQERCPCVVCLDEENITDKTIGEYIPPANKVSTFGHFQVECSNSDSRKDFTIRELKISRTGPPTSKALKVRHYQFKGWNDSKSVPEHIQPFLKLIVDVENTRNSQQTEQPIVVHCVTGAERSGLFCVVSILLEKAAAEQELSVLNTVCQVRSRRQSAIENIEQLRYCYGCVTEMLEMTDSKPYCNPDK